jgi:hypothetical protein
MSTHERKMQAYRVVITEIAKQPVPKMIQWGERDQPDCHRILDGDRVSVPYRGGQLWFAAVDVIYPYWTGDPDRDDAVRYFRVGQSRTYLSRRAAEHKAAIWQAHGCKTRIDVSEPIVWAAS